MNISSFPPKNHFFDVQFPSFEYRQGRLHPKRVERLEDHKDGKGQPTEGGKKLLPFLCHNFLSAYSDNITNSLLCVCVWERTRGRELSSAREREGEREQEQARGRLRILSPTPHQTTGRRGQTLSCQSNPLVAAGIISATNY